MRKAIGKTATPPVPWARTDEPLLWLIGTGHEIIEPGARYFEDCAKRTDDHFGLQMTISGTGYYERGGKTVLLRPGMAWMDFIPGDFSYGFPPDTKEPYEFVWVDMVGSLAKYWWEHIGASFGRTITVDPDGPVASLMLDLARQHHQGLLHDRYLISARLYDLLMTLMSALSHSRLAAETRVSRAMDLIHQHATEPDYGIEALADELRCSREHLTRQFKAAVGVNPSEYLSQQRVQLARRELRQTDDKLERVAQRCGFSNANYFCRVFRQQTGMTPRYFRTVR